jgi:PhzF family phenazine biosynthesis protein
VSDAAEATRQPPSSPGNDRPGTEILRLAAFTTDPGGGNPAGVVVAPAPLSDTEMQRIAAEIGYSETGFLTPVADDASSLEGRRFRVRYFSPVAEVPFCGHVTIAAGVALAERFGAGAFEFVTNAGTVPVSVTPDPEGRLRATLTSVEPRIKQPTGEFVESVLDALHWSSADLDPAFSPTLAYAGAWHLILAVRDQSTLADLAYDFERLRQLMLAEDLTTVQLVWREAIDRFRSRNPFPVGGVVEDPATGAAAAALGAYIRHHDGAAAPSRFTISQGAEMGRPSLLTVELSDDQPGIRVSGTAVRIPH